MLVLTTYYARAVWGQALDKKFTSDEFSFSTLEPPDTAPPAEVRNIFGVVGSKTALLFWENPPDPDFSEVIIIRRDDRFPEQRYDGETVFRSNTSYYRDAGLENNTTYYYSIFSLDANQNSSLPITVAFTPEEQLPEAPNPPLSVAGTTTPLQTSSGQTFRLRLPASRPALYAISLSWQNPEDEQFLGVQIVRNEEALPANAFDGEVVFRGRAESFTDSNLASSTRYFYGLFAFDWEHTFSPAVFIADTTLVEEPPEKDTPAEDDTKEPVATTASIEENERVLQDLQLQIIEIQKIIENLIRQVQALLQKMLVALGDQPPEEKTVHSVTIEKDGLYPRDVTISLGDTVRWINNTDSPAWPASNVHATHSVYPERGGCINSLFDACRELQKEEAYSFTFEREGVWQYHDHVFPTRQGTIIVE